MCYFFSTFYFLACCMIEEAFIKKCCISLLCHFHHGINPDRMPVFKMTFDCYIVLAQSILLVFVHWRRSHINARRSVIAELIFFSAANAFPTNRGELFWERSVLKNFVLLHYKKSRISHLFNMLNLFTYTQKNQITHNYPLFLIELEMFFTRDIGITF